MKVAIIGSKNYDTLEYNFADSFKYLGHEATIIDMIDIIPLKYKYNYYAIKYIKEYDELIFKLIAKKVISINPDLVIGTYRFINPNCIDMIKRNLKSVPIIHINPDALTTFEYQQIFLSKYDIYFSKDPYIVRFMKNAIKLNAHYLPEAFNPRIHSRPNIEKQDAENKCAIDVLAFGNIYPYRAKMIKMLIDSGIEVAIYGNKSKRYSIKEVEDRYKNEYITGKRKSELLYGSKIVFNNFHYAEIESVNAKYFEIAGIGGFQICDYRKTIEEYSPIDSKKYTYKTIDEAVKLIKYYLDNPFERYNIINEQYIYFIKNHTYENRIESILKEIFK